MMKVLGKMKLGSSAKIELDEAVLFKSKAYIIKKRSNSIEKRHKGVQPHNKNTVEDSRNCSEKNDVYGNNYSFRSKKDEISLVKQTKIALNTYDDKGCLIKKYESVPCAHSEHECGDEFLPIKQNNLKAF